MPRPSTIGPAIAGLVALVVSGAIAILAPALADNESQRELDRLRARLARVEAIQESEEEANGLLGFPSGDSGDLETILYLHIR